MDPALERDLLATVTLERAQAQPGVMEFLLPGEDPVAFVISRLHLEDRLQPSCGDERRLVFEIACAMWRRGRVDAAERALLAEAGGMAQLVASREGRAQLASLRAARNEQWRVEYHAAAEIRRSQKANDVDFRRHRRDKEKALKALREEHATDLLLAEGRLNAALDRAEAAEARLAALAVAGPPAGGAVPQPIVPGTGRLTSVPRPAPAEPPPPPARSPSAPEAHPKTAAGPPGSLAAARAKAT